MWGIKETPYYGRDRSIVVAILIIIATTLDCGQMDVASKQVPIILACEAGGGLDKVVIREGEKGCRRATHVSTWPAQSDVAGDTAYLRACKRSYATWTSGSAICHCHISEFAVYIYICPSPSHHSEKLHDSREHVGTTTFLNT